MSSPPIVLRGAVSAHCAEKCPYSRAGVSGETPFMDHDAAWKRLFGLPVLIEHLLKSFARPVEERVDFSTLRQQPANSVDADARQRHGEESLPLSGNYLLLDANRRAREDLPRDNLVAAVFELNAAETLGEMRARVRSLLDRLRGEPRRAVFDWLRLVAPRMFPQSDAAAAIGSLERENAEIETEKETMMALAKRVQEWEAEWHRQGFEEGLKQGLEQGEKQGLAAERELLRRLATRMFGTASGDALVRRLAEISDPNRLARIGERIIDCDTGAELFEWLDADRAGTDTH